ncbi:MAG: hypothetical protein M1375_01915 [Candidatus Thermoplasmatota archaeon]|jgi:hypothetical protein|nr:hypothetical protein [Candidatus Thermoplasmatota archaeon]
MIIKDFEKILDFRCELSFDSEEQVSGIGGSEYNVVGRIRYKGDSGILVLNGRRQKNSEEIKNVNMKDYYFSDKIDVTGLKMFQLHKKIMALNSTIMDAIFLKSYRVKYIFRFHRVDLQGLTEIITEMSENLSNLQIDFLGHANGFLDSFRNIARTVDLQYVELSASIPPEFLSITKDPIILSMGVMWNRQIRKIGDSETRALFKDANNLLSKRDDVKVVSAEDRIYEATFTNELINYFSQEADRFEIPILGAPEKLVGKSFNFAFVVPKSSFHDFSKIVFGAVRRFEKWKVFINFSDVIEVIPPQPVQ